MKVYGECYWPVRVYYEDTDSAGLVYHANYLRFFERARTEWLRQLGFDPDILQQLQVLFVVRSLQIEFVRPARYNQLLWVATRVLKTGRVSLQMGQRLLSAGAFDPYRQTVAEFKLPQEITPLCRVHVKLACLDAPTLKLRLIPKTIGEEIASAGC